MNYTVLYYIVLSIIDVYITGYNNIVFIQMRTMCGFD